MDCVSLLQNFQMCLLFDNDIVREKYDDVIALEQYIEESLSLRLSELNFIDENNNNLILGDKLLYGLFTFFDLYRDNKDWQQTSVFNFWGTNLNKRVPALISAQQVYYSNLKKKLKFSLFFSEYMRKFGFQKWTCENGNKLYVENHFYNEGSCERSGKVLCLEKIPPSISPDEFTDILLSYQNGNLAQDNFISFITEHFFETKEVYPYNKIKMLISQDFRETIDDQELRSILNFLIFQAYTLNWKHLYVFSPSISILTGSMFLYLFEDLTQEEILFFHSVSNMVFSQMMIAFAYANNT